MAERGRGASGPRFVEPSEDEARRIRERLGAWFASEQRDLPWRRTRDPYAIWVSEAMLQQTRVEVVLDYWPRFLERFPTAAKLAEAAEEEVLEAWSGLGYYRRARALQAAARVVASEHGGVFPRDLDAALSLPGVGPYTAGAVTSIAYDEPAPLVDGNVERVFARLLGLDGERTSGPLQRACWDAARFFIAREGDGIVPSAWNQALMELGALVCTPRAPRCNECPVAPQCKARAAGDPESIPRARRAKETIEVALEIYVVERSGRWLLERRPSEGRMAGMWQFPTVETTKSRLFPEELPASLASGLEPEHDLFDLSHGITHHRIRARVRAARLAGALEENSELRWFALDAAEDLALTGMARKVIGRLDRRGETLFGDA
ncbi:MAG: A/G-specific adenine glycosylase [Planctomycetota bacterium]